MILLRWLARSRLRLMVCALVSLATLFAAANPIAAHIRDHSDSVTDDTMILTGWLLALLIGAMCLAILIGERLFGEGWRLYIICGEPEPLREDDFLIVAPQKSHFFGLSLLLAGLVGAGAWGLEATTGGFLADYQRMGHKRSILRGANEPLKQELIADLAEVRREVFVNDAIAILDMTWRNESQSEELRRTAIVAIGRLGHSLVTSMHSWIKAGVKDHWEIPQVRYLRRSVAPALVELAKEPNSPFGPEIYLLLGKLGHTEGVEALLQRVEATSAPLDASWQAAVVGLGIAQDETSLARLIAVLETRSRDMTPQHLTDIAFAIGEVARHYIPGTDKGVDKEFTTLSTVVGSLLGPDGPASDALPRDHVRCTGADILRKTGASTIAEPLFALFDAEGADINCEASHVDTGEKAPELVVRAEPLRLRILRALGLIALGNEHVLEWVRERHPKPEYGEFIQSQLRRILELTGETPS
ncbi:MAG: hypothetical protein ACPGU1_16405 [Myxococcota bacterium]